MIHRLCKMNINEDIVYILSRYEYNGTNALCRTNKEMFTYIKCLIKLDDQKTINMSCKPTAILRFGIKELVEWLFDGGYKFNHFVAIHHIAECGHLHILIWLDERRVFNKYETFLGCSIQYGHIDMLIWLYENKKNISCSYASHIIFAVAGGQTVVIAWLCENRPDVFDGIDMTRLLITVSRAGDLDMLIVLCRYHVKYYDSRVICDSARMGHIHVVMWLHYNIKRADKCTLECAQAGSRNEVGLFGGIKCLEVIDFLEQVNDDM